METLSESSHLQHQQQRFSDQAFLDVPLFYSAPCSVEANSLKWLLSASVIPYDERFTWFPNLKGLRKLPATRIQWHRQLFLSLPQLLQYLQHIQVRPVNGKAQNTIDELQSALITLAKDIEQYWPQFLKQYPKVWKEQLLKPYRGPIKWLMWCYFTTTSNRRFKVVNGDGNQIDPNLVESIKKQLAYVWQLWSSVEKQLSGHYLEALLAALVSHLVMPPGFTKQLGIEPELVKQNTWVGKFRRQPIGNWINSHFDRLYAKPSALPTIHPIWWLQRSVLETLNRFYSASWRRRLFRMLRWLDRPLRLGKHRLLIRYDAVQEVLENAAAYQTRPQNNRRMERNLFGSFVRSLDPSPQHTREKELLRECMDQSDVALLVTLVQKDVEQIVQEAQALRELDVVQDYARKIVLNSVLGRYFGIKGPSSTLLAHWVRALFIDSFLNPLDQKSNRIIAAHAAEGLRAYLLEEINRVREQLKAGEGDHDQVLTRMVALQSRYSWLDDETIRRNVTGLLISSLETLSQSVVLVVSELMNRPVELALARGMALDYDYRKLLAYCHEALRFNPPTPMLARYCRQNSTMVMDSRRPFEIHQGETLWCSTLSAMFDERRYTLPREFRIGRDIPHFQYGWGIHTCQGKYINDAILVELVAGLLRLRNLQCRGPIRYNGGLPEQMMVTFSPSHSL